MNEATGTTFIVHGGYDSGTESGGSRSTRRSSGFQELERSRESRRPAEQASRVAVPGGDGQRQGGSRHESSRHESSRHESSKHESSKHGSQDWKMGGERHDTIRATTPGNGDQPATARGSVPEAIARVPDRDGQQDQARQSRQAGAAGDRSSRGPEHGHDSPDGDAASLNSLPSTGTDTELGAAPWEHGPAPAAAPPAPPVNYIDLLAQCLEAQTDCGKAVPLGPALAAAGAAAASVAGLIPATALLLRNMREAGAGPLADVAAGMVRDEEVAQQQLEAARVKAPAWRAYNAIVQFQVALDAAAAYYSRACAAVNGAASFRSAGVERSRMEALVADEAAAASLAADLLQVAASFKLTLAAAVETLTKLHRPEIAKPLQSLQALLGAVGTGEAALRSAASADTIVPAEVLRRALNLSSTRMRALCDNVLAHEGGTQEDAAALEATHKELKQLLATAVAAAASASQDATAATPGGASFARLDAHNLAAERQLQAANDTVVRLQGKLAAVGTRRKRAQLQGIMTATKGACAEVARVQAELRSLQKRARHLHAGMAKRQESTNFQLDVGEQSRDKCVARSAAEFYARRKQTVAALLATLRSVLGELSAGFSATRRTAADARLAAAFHSASVGSGSGGGGWNVAPLHDRFHALWRDLCAGNEALIQARLVVLYAHVFSHVQRAENGARAAMLRAERG